MLVKPKLFDVGAFKNSEKDVEYPFEKQKAILYPNQADLTVEMKTKVLESITEEENQDYFYKMKKVLHHSFVNNFNKKKGEKNKDETRRNYYFKRYYWHS